MKPEGNQIKMSESNKTCTVTLFAVDFLLRRGVFVTCVSSFSWILRQRLCRGLYARRAVFGFLVVL
jgi:hypothetical protein